MRNLRPAVPATSLPKGSYAEYALTDRSRSLVPLIRNLVDWALDNLSGILKDRQTYHQ